MSQDKEEILNYDYFDFGGEYSDSDSRVLDLYEKVEFEADDYGKYEEGEFVADIDEEEGEFGESPVLKGEGPAESREQQEEEPAEEVPQERSEAELMLEHARIQSQRIIEDAVRTADKIKNDALKVSSEAEAAGYQKGYSDGLEQGRRDGFSRGTEEAEAEMNDKRRELLDEFSKALYELDRQKTDFIRQYSDEMKDLVMAIAEKVINVSLRSSGQVIKRMILGAVQNSHDKEWVKIYVSDCDADLMVREDTDILDALKNVSDYVHIEVIEKGNPGDLIVEFPDQAIDAGVGTQLNNIREMLADVQ